MNKEPLEFCRVKKINEKGFGFLKSLYYKGDVFFHFSQIKKEEFLETLNKMKRGEFILFFTSRKLNDGRRKADNFWYKLKDVPSEYISIFKEKIIEEYYSDVTNLYDLIAVFKELKTNNYLEKDDISKILNSEKIKSLPTTIIPYLTNEEINQLKEILKIDELKNSPDKPFWYDDIVKL
jgi:cold shock CspA family protein